MAEFQAFDGHYLFTFKNKFDQWLKTKNSTASDSEEITRLLNEFILHLYKKKKLEPNWTPDSEVILGISAQLLRCVNCQDSFKVAKVCQIWDHTLKLPNITVPGPTVDLFLEWYHKCLLHSNEVILLDIMNCLASAVVLKEVKQSKALNLIMGSSGLLVQKTYLTTEVTELNSLALKIFRNFTHCPGEKDWSSISKEIIQVCIDRFVHTLEFCLKADPNNMKLLRAVIYCFHGLENIFVRFQGMAASHLPHILGLAYGYILFGVPGQSVKFVPLQPSSVPFAEIASVKAEPGKAPTVRKKRPPGKGGPAKPRNQQDVHNDEVPGHLAPKFKPAVEFRTRSSWSNNDTVAVASSSDSELSDSDSGSVLRLKEAQAKIRSSALKMLAAAFKFCDRRSIMSYWSAFLPDSSSSPVFRPTLITPVLKDSSVKVRCNALVALSSLLLAIQPTLSMASFQENPRGAFIPFSQTLSETIIAVQRSLLLSLSAEQTVGAFIQVFKCLTVAASVFPYEKLPSELVSKTVSQCTPFLEFKDPDVKVACLSVLRVLLCTHSNHPQIVRFFWDSENNKCWLLEHCLALINGPLGFPLMLESLLVIGEVTRSNLQLSQPYLNDIVHSICRKLVADGDPGIQIRCAKALSLVCSSILQEMDKEDGDQIVPRDDAVRLWTHILRHGIAEVLQSNSHTPLRAEACSTLATVGSHIFECLPRELRILFATLALGCAADGDSSVRAAAIRTLGFAVTFNTLSDDASFLLDSSEQILILLKDSNLLVALNASWALGNLADTLDKDKNCLLDELPGDFVVNLIRAAVQAAQGPMKVRCNVIRALGIFLKIMTDIPAEGDETAVLLDQAISTVAKQITTGNLMKNRWNACYACGNIMQNVSLLTAFSHWMDRLLDSLLLVFLSCSNFKVRIAAANALLQLNQRQLLGNHYVRVWITLLDCLAEAEQIDDFNEFQHHETMCRQICNTLSKLVTLMTREDLGQLHETLVKYYDIVSAHFGKFLVSLLPDQLELVTEASGCLRKLGTLRESLTGNQLSTLELFQDLLVIPS